MKTFKGYLKEDAPAWQSSTSEKIFDFAEIQYMQIPLSSSTMEWIFQVQVPRATVFHVTNAIGLGKLKRLQNKKKSISAFFNMDASTMESGIQGGGGLVVELDANIIMSGKGDLMSMPDKTGRRWVELYNIDPKKTMHKEMEQLLMDLAVKHDPKNKEYLKISPDIGLGAWQKLGSDLRKELEGFEPKKMSMVIADYIDGVNAILKKHKKDIQGAVHGYYVRRGAVAVKHPSGRMVGGDSEIKEWNVYDEQIVDKIKILKVHTFNTTTRETDWIAKSVIPRLGKIPLKHWVGGATELSTYVSQVAEAEVRSIGRSKR
jgi:hypothetical protein